MQSSSKTLLCILLMLSIVGCKKDTEKSSPALNDTRAQSAERVQSEKSLKLISSLAGSWIVVSSTGKPDSGHVFLAMLKDTPIEIAGGKMSWVEQSGVDQNNRELEMKISKQIVLRPDVSKSAIDLKTDSPKYKTWSRVGIIRARADEIDLCVNFPQGPRPSDFTAADDGRECVLLRRVKTGTVE